MNRAQLQRLAMEWVRDAKAPLAARRWAAAYYLSGYAIEFGLKACVLVHVAATAEVIFEDRRYSEKCWTHNLKQLVDLAGLKGIMDADLAADPDFLANWAVVKDWSELSRYERRPKVHAEELYGAVTDRNHGVLRWIKRHW